MSPRCATGCGRRAAQLHHVVYRQEVRRRGGDIRAAANLIPVCVACHAAHHARSSPLPLRVLPDSAFQYASELLDAAAFDYLARRYAGDDGRLDALLS